MHDAYDLSQLIKLTPTVQIESIAAFDEYLFVGTKLGHLLIYTVSKKLGEQKQEVQLLIYNKHFSKKPVQQLDVIPAYQVLVSLSDNVVSFHNIHKLSAQTGSATLNATILQKTRGATFFTLDITKETSLTGAVSCFARLCVVVKRKLLLFYWKNGEFHEMEPEISVPDVPKTILLCQDTVVLGYKSEYSLFSLSKEKFEKLFPIGSAPIPIITRVDKEVFALARDTKCILMNSSGDLTQMYAVQWAENPLCVVYDKPYLVGVLPDAVEIRTVDPNLFIQSMACAKATLVARGRPGVIYVASSSHLWCLYAVPAPQQIKSLLQDKQFELALKVACDYEDECEEEQKKNVDNIQTLYAYHLFTAKAYEKAMAQFLTLGTNPSDVIKLFPELLPPSAGVHGGKLSDRDLEAGLSALIDYLTEVRRRGLNSSKQAGLLSIIDTTLLKCYLKTNDAMVAPLLRLNMVHFNEAERVLKMENKVTELVILYQTNGLHEQALALLKQQHKLDKIIEYLQHLADLPLILEYAKWVISENPSEGVKIFMEDTTEMEQLNRPHVLNFLLENAKEYAIRYLEHAIDTWKDTNPILHTTLANLYHEKYRTLEKTTESRQEAMKVRDKLLQFLEHSNFYKPQALLDLFPKDGMFEERAIMLGKLGRHEQALSIYVCVLEDVERAKQYCERVCAGRGAGHDTVYVILMKILISPPESWLTGVTEKPYTSLRDIATAVEILTSNPDKVNPSQALPVLPDSVPLRELKTFLKGSLHARLAERHHAQIVKGLVYSEHLQMQEKRIRSEARRVMVTEQHICVICSKRFTSQTIFALVSNGLVHYGCLKEKQVS